MSTNKKTEDSLIQKHNKIVYLFKNTTTSKTI